MTSDKQFQMRVDEAFLHKVDRWRADQPMPPSRAEAIRTLVSLGIQSQSAPPVEHIRPLSGHTPANMVALTARENQILSLVSHQWSNKEVAQSLALSEHTVKIHIHNIMRKLRTVNRTETVAAFLENEQKNDASAENDTQTN